MIALLLSISTGLSAIDADPAWVKIGPYRLSVPNENGLLIRPPKFGKTLDFSGHGGLSCMPRLASVSDSLLLGLNGTILAVSPSGERLWSKQLDYYHNPAHILVSGDTAIYDFGPNHVPITMESRERDRGSRRQQRILASSAKTGKLRWNRPWLEVGTPLSEIDSRSFLALRPNGLDGDEWFLETRRTSDAAWLKTWALPNLKLKSERLSDLAEALRTYDVRWRRSGRDLIVEEVRGFRRLDLSLPPGGFRARLRIDGPRASLDVLSPTRRGFRLRPRHVK